MTGTNSERAASMAQHLDFLWSSVQARPDVVAAHRLCEQLRDDAALSVVLRDHRQAPITSEREIEQRAAMDHAIQAYSQLAVAGIAGYVPADFGADKENRVRHMLGREPVRRYYEEHYKLFLPSLLRLHVTKVAPLPHDDGEFAWGCFQWFIRFSGRFEKDADLATFIDLMDGFHWGRFSISSFLSGLKAPETALGGLVKPADTLGMQDRALLGMFRFFAFCKELAPALEAMADAPLTQSACFFYYAYWFNEFKEDVGARVESGLEVLERWLTSSAVAGTAAADEGQKTVDQTRAAIKALVSGRFAVPLLKHYHQRIDG